jgi:hypothetical protein
MKLTGGFLPTYQLKEPHQLAATLLTEHLLDAHTDLARLMLPRQRSLVDVGSCPAASWGHLHAPRASLDAGTVRRRWAPALLQFTFS